MGSKKSKSSSSNSTTTNNIDRRMALENSSALTQDGSVLGELATALNVKASGKNSKVNVNNAISMSDFGAIESAFDFAKNNDATNSDSFTKLLGLADKMFTGVGDLVSQSQQSTLSQIEAINAASNSQISAFQTAANDKTGSIDQKTILIIGALGLGALVLRKR